MVDINLGFGTGSAYVETMQDFGRKKDAGINVCDSVNFLDTGRLKDERDNKIYWVTKLYDGNCWMTQNLDLDLTNITLTANDSDVSTNWTPNLTSAIWNTTGSNDIKYYDPGWYTYTTPVNGNNSCGDANGLQNCTSKGWKLVDGTYAGYDAHYLAGNYYSWGAATAGSTNTSGDATKSICPRGWKLPPNSGAGAYSNLGLTTSNITISPYYFVYGGLVNTGSLRSAGSDGYYWSAMASDNYGGSGAYGLSFNGSNINPSGSNLRYVGYSVRCVAR